MNQPKMKIIATWEIYDVISLNRLDWWTTVRAFPLRETIEWQPMSYVIRQWKGEDTEVNAELITVSE